MQQELSQIIHANERKKGRNFLDIIKLKTEESPPGKNVDTPKYETGSHYSSW